MGFRRRKCLAGEPVHNPAWWALAYAASLVVILFLSARHSGPLVIPVAAAGGVWASRRLRRTSRARRGRRLAAWAAHAPAGPSGPPDLERVLIADIVAAVHGDARAVRLARAVVRGCVADRWLRELALERLTRAGDDAPVTPAINSLGTRRRAATTWFAISAAVVVLSGLMSVRPPVSRGAVAIATLVVVVRWAEMYEARVHLPQLLASSATLPAAPSRFLIPEPALAALLADFAGGEPAVVDEAVAALDRQQRVPEADRGRARLRATRDAL